MFDVIVGRSIADWTKLRVKEIGQDKFARRRLDLILLEPIEHVLIGADEQVAMLGAVALHAFGLHFIHAVARPGVHGLADPFPGTVDGAGQECVLESQAEAFGLETTEAVAGYFLEMADIEGPLAQPMINPAGDLHVGRF